MDQESNHMHQESNHMSRESNQMSQPKSQMASLKRLFSRALDWVASDMVMKTSLYNTLRPYLSISLLLESPDQISFFVRNLLSLF